MKNIILSALLFITCTLNAEYKPLTFVVGSINDIPKEFFTYPHSVQIFNPEIGVYVVTGVIENNANITDKVSKYKTKEYNLNEKQDIKEAIKTKPTMAAEFNAVKIKITPTVTPTRTPTTQLRGVIK